MFWAPGPPQHHHMMRKAREVLCCGPQLPQEHEGVGIMRRDNYTDSILYAKALQKYADTFSYIKRSTALINTGRKIQSLSF